MFGRHFARILVVLLALGSLVAAPHFTRANASPASSSVAAIWSEPASGYGFLDNAILHSPSPIDLSMYTLQDTATENDLIARAHAGVAVRVMLNAAYVGKHNNLAAYSYLRAHGVPVVWAPAGQIFHAKYLLAGRAAYIGSGNLQPQYYSSTRDFWVQDTNPSDVAAIAATFRSDYAGQAATPVASGGLVWSPGSTLALVALIASAHRTLLVENEEMSNSSIESALAAAASRGVSVKVVMTKSSEWAAALASLAQRRVHVRVLTSSQVYIHAKVICADCSPTGGSVFIGSENFSTSSLSYNRELGLITSSLRAVRAVAAVVNADYAVGSNIALVTRTTSPVPTTPTGAGAVTIIAFPASISPGDEDSLSARSSRAHDQCSLGVTLPSGYESHSKGLGAQRVGPNGDVTWTWRIGTSTHPGTALATITCAAGRLTRSFSIS